MEQTSPISPTTNPISPTTNPISPKTSPFSPKTSTVGHKDPVVVHVENNADTELQALFDAVLKPDDKKPQPLPLRMRQLPKSFFRPPSTGGSKSPSVSHSRENSSDKTVAGPSGLACRPLTVHSRVRSSPATLQKTLAVRQQPQQHPAKRRRHVSESIDELGPLPKGWARARTYEGQIYFLDHSSKTTQWEDPRKNSAVEDQTLGAHQHGRSAEQLLSPPRHNVGKTPTNSPHTVHHYSPLYRANNNNNNNNLQALGCQQAYTVDGKPYFLNYTTPWFDSTMPTALFQSAPMSGAGPQAEMASWLTDCASHQAQQEHLKLCHQRDATVGGGNTRNADHSRQESTDSGLGLSSSYSLPRHNSAEDFLSSSMDENMDCGSIPEAADNNPGPSSSDMPAVDSQDGQDETMDVIDQLFPTLQLEEDFSGDILEEVKRSLIDPNNRPESFLNWR